MRLVLAVAALVAVAGCGSPTPASSPSSAAPSIVVPSLLPSSPTPAGSTTSLANGHGLATHWYGVSHPSLPNYLAMISGSDQGVHDDGTSYSFAGPTLVDQLAQRGIGWKAYMEDMPAPCFGGSSSGRYAK